MTHIVVLVILEQGLSMKLHGRSHQVAGDVIFHTKEIDKMAVRGRSLEALYSVLKDVSIPLCVSGYIPRGLKAARER